MSEVTDVRKTVSLILLLDNIIDCVDIFSWILKNIIGMYLASVSNVIFIINANL